MSSFNYRDLQVWQKAMDFVLACYEAAADFPKTEQYGLISQLQRAAVSIPANIAEGHGRRHTREFIQHLSVAYGSLMEVETHLQIAARLGYLKSDRAAPLLQSSAEIGRMLNGLTQSLEQRLNASS
ncbi:MAG TPA: four helix bundle protein [Pirellulales bacterium]